ncbi:MAG: DUF423 domain-containing protein [Alphaproteobacteria bacterium]|jgi:uncharacterized membrane protein YgdD (TMEM256/DUF423 family)|nr:DUF423 domain-containing protein [Alphaproteobacteria bacterium]MDP6566171.1 DUF423 domain-containing protein [Alphaproteobacteria bacterium]MDP6813588.1 DUF423 domain-containing protein [Alphaproteobacteria bacterium]
MRLAICFAGISGFLAVFLAAGAAHDLQELLDAKALERIDTGVRYQIWHALAILAAAALAVRGVSRALRLAAGAFAVGTLLFSGGLYLLAFTGLTPFGWLAPVGGLAFMVGWAALFWHGWRMVGDG